MQKYIKVLNKLQVFHFRSTVHTNTTPTVIIYTCPCYKKTSIMVDKFEFKLVDQIGTSVSFWPKNEMLKL